MRDRNAGEGILLENREVVAIVVGSLVVLGIVFYLGVSVGKGLPREEAPAPRTLDALDREAEAPEPPELTFPERLTDAEPVPSPGAPTDEAAAQARAAEQARAEEAAAQARAEEQAREEEAAAKARAEEQARAEEAAAKERAAEQARVEAQARAAEPKGQGGGFTVQLASFPERGEAEALVRKLGEAGLAAFVVEATLPERGTFYRVRVGRFSSREEANAYLGDLKREGRDGIVMPVDG